MASTADKASAAGGGGACLVPAVPAAVSPAAAVRKPTQNIRALLLPVAQLLDQGGDEAAAQALAYGIAAEVAGPHGVRKVQLEEKGTGSGSGSSRSSGTALLHVNWDASNAHAVCAALASELLKAQRKQAFAAVAAPTAAGGGAAPTAAQLRNAQSAVHAFHRLVQNTKTSLGWNFLAQLFPDYDDSRLEAVWRGVSGKDAVRLVLLLGEPEGFGDCEDVFGEAHSESGVSCEEEDMDAADDAQHDAQHDEQHDVSSADSGSSEDSTLAVWRKHKEDQAAVVWALACKAL